MIPEFYFLMYARPCADFMHQRGEISEEEVARIDLMLNEKKGIDRAFIEKVFYKAIIPLKKLSCNYWNLETIRHYFQDVHNQLIDSKSEGFEHLKGVQKELCKVHEAVVNAVKEDYYEVSYEKEKTKVLKGWVNDAKLGDVVFIHYAMAVEKK